MLKRLVHSLPCIVTVGTGLVPFVLLSHEPVSVFVLCVMPVIQALVSAAFSCLWRLVNHGLQGAECSSVVHEFHF